MVNGQRLSVSFIIFTQLCGNKRGPNLVNKNETCAASQIKSRPSNEKKELWPKPGCHTHTHTQREGERGTHIFPTHPNTLFFFGYSCFFFVTKATWALFCWIRTYLLHAHACACACACMSVHVCARVNSLWHEATWLISMWPLAKILTISCSVCKLCNYNQFCAKLANKFRSNNCTHSLSLWLSLTHTPRRPRPPPTHMHR